MEQLNTPTQTSWREVDEARMELEEAPGFMFTLLERPDGVRAGAWFFEGRPLVLTPVGEA